MRSGSDAMPAVCACAWWTLLNKAIAVAISVQEKRMVS
jgi:hypothetical protein